MKQIAIWAALLAALIGLVGCGASGISDKELAKKIKATDNNFSNVTELLRKRIKHPFCHCEVVPAVRDDRGNLNVYTGNMGLLRPPM
ncbi:hypothetical protein HY772_08325 [Candidatus Woesearchaeota archaeon]|nr:hypothetical protein [Candidatus Woesearchaeota archaeon]